MEIANTCHVIKDIVFNRWCLDIVITVIFTLAQNRDIFYHMMPQYIAYWSMR